MVETSAKLNSCLFTARTSQYIHASFRNLHISKNWLISFCLFIIFLLFTFGLISLELYQAWSFTLTHLCEDTGILTTSQLSKEERPRKTKVFMTFSYSQIYFTSLCHSVQPTFWVYYVLHMIKYFLSIEESITPRVMERVLGIQKLSHAKSALPLYI